MNQPSASSMPKSVMGPPALKLIPKPEHHPFALRPFRDDQVGQTADQQQVSRQGGQHGERMQRRRGQVRLRRQHQRHEGHIADRVAAQQ